MHEVDKGRKDRRFRVWPFVDKSLPVKEAPGIPERCYILP